MSVIPPSKEVLFRVSREGTVMETCFPGIAVPPPGENLFDMIPRFLRPQYEENHRRVLNHAPLRGLMHLARKGDRSLMWTACFKSASHDGKSIEGNCVDVRRRREALVGGSTLDLACRFLESRFSGEVKIDDLLQITGVSRATLHRLFVSHLSISAVDYLTMLRVDRAIELMRHRDPDLATLALESGFCDQSYFGKRFKEFTRFSPGKFLKHCDWAVE